MMDNYLKQLENLISPRNFNIQFFKENKKDLESTRKEEVLLSNNDNKKLIEEYLRKMKDGSDKTLVQKGNNTIVQLNKDFKTNIIQQSIDLNQGNKKDKKYSLSPKRKIDHSQTQSSPNSKNSNFNATSNQIQDADIDLELNQKIHEMNVTNMNYRHEVSTLKAKIQETDKKLSLQANTIQKLEKQKENDSKYLVKLENLIAQENKSNSNININLNVSNNSGMKIDDISRSQQFSQNYEGEIKNLKLNFNEKSEVKEFLTNLLEENQKLKLFQSQVEEISKNYDLVNDNIIDSMKAIQLMIENINKSDVFENYQFNLLITHFENIIQYIQKTLEIKQNEYIFLTNSKEQEVQKMNEELLKMRTKVESLKQDRLTDQKLINKLEELNQSLKNKINDYINSFGNLPNSNTTTNQKGIEPVKSSMKTFVKKIEKNLDLQDKNNVKFIETLNGKIKI